MGTQKTKQIGEKKSNSEKLSLEKNVVQEGNEITVCYRFP